MFNGYSGGKVSEIIKKIRPVLLPLDLPDDEFGFALIRFIIVVEDQVVGTAEGVRRLVTYGRPVFILFSNEPATIVNEFLATLIQIWAGNIC